MVRPRRRRLIGLALLSPVLAALLGFLWFLHAAAAPPAEPTRRTDAIVVLTGGAERVATGLRLLEAGLAPRLLVSGAHPDVTLTGLAATAGMGAAPLRGRVALGRAARSTRGNAEETAAWAGGEGGGVRSLRVVTAGYHMPRALLELRRTLPGAVALVPHPVRPPPAAPRDPAAAAPTRLATWSLLGREYGKLVGAALGLSRVVADAPAPR